MVLKSQKGSALVLVLLIGFLGTVLGTTLYTVSSANATQVQERTNRLQADYFAKSGVNLALGIISSDKHKNARGECVYLIDRPEKPQEYWGTLEEGLTAEEPSTEDYTINVIITYFEKTDDRDAYYRIESQGFVRGSGVSTAQSASQAQYEITIEQVNDATGNGSTDPDNDSSDPASADKILLDKIFAVGKNPKSTKSIDLKGHSFIYGPTATNSESRTDIFSDKKIYGNLHIGPNGESNAFKDCVYHYLIPIFGFYISDFSVKNLDAIKNFPLPTFPNANIDNTTCSSIDYKNDEATINSSGNYEVIDIKTNQTLYIDVSDQDVILQTKDLKVNGKIKINATGKGKVKLFVTNEFKLNKQSGSDIVNLIQSLDFLHNITTDSARNFFISNLDSLYSINTFKNLLINYNGSINAFGISPDRLNLYYSGKEPLTFDKKTMFFGSVYAKTADININNHCLITGNIICGGTKVTLGEIARLALYAPKASLECQSNAILGGKVVVRDISMSGNCGIVYSHSINTKFFNQLEWNLPDQSNVEEDEDDPVSSNIIQYGEWK